MEPARWYYWADRLGVMVWQDMPALPNGHNEKLSEADKTGFRTDVSAIVDQLKGETSIIGWIPFNEGWGQWSIPAAAELAAQIKQRDPSRTGQCTQWRQLLRHERRSARGRCVRRA